MDLHISRVFNTWELTIDDGDEAIVRANNFDDFMKLMASHIKDRIFS